MGGLNETETKVPARRGSGGSNISRWPKGCPRPAASLTTPALVWDVPYFPTYYVPLDDVRAGLLRGDGGVAPSPSHWDGRTFTIRAGNKEVPGAALRYEDSPIEELRDLIRLDRDSMDAWFEEEEQLFTHPRDPIT